VAIVIVIEAEVDLIVVVEEVVIFAVTEDAPGEVYVDARAAQSVKESFILVYDEELLIVITFQEDTIIAEEIDIVHVQIEIIGHGGTSHQGDHRSHHYAYSNNQLYASHRRYLLLSRAEPVSPAFCSYPLSITDK
jgi:hypothetical protein